MPQNFTRPNLPYANVSLPNDKRYQLLTRSNRRPPTDIMIDSDFDYVIDSLNILDLQMEGIVLGQIPGIADPLNASKLFTTDGDGNGSWVFVQASNILDQSITGNKLFPQTITSLQLADGGIPASKIASNAITTIKILDANITFAKMAPDSVGTINLVDANVTLEKMAADSVDTPNLVDDCVTTPKILDANVTTAKIADANITTAKILDLNVTTGKIADGAITLPKIAGGVLTPAASKADQIAAVSSTVYTSPSVQQNHPSAVKFICVFDGTTVGTNPPLFGYNVVSIERISSGLYKINFTIPFTSAVFGVSITSSFRASSPTSYLTGYYVSSTANSVTITTQDINLIVGDSSYVSIEGFGLQ